MHFIEFNGRTSKELGLTLGYFKLEPPAPKIIKSDIPYMNGAYDFSNLYGEQVYNERRITCELGFKCENKELLHVKYSEILNWLYTDNKAKLIYSYEPELFFLAKVESIQDEKIFYRLGKILVEFIAYPFKYGKNNEGTDIWDDFNFELDYAQHTKFSIDTSKSIEIYNPSGRRITPTVICSSQMEIIKGNVTYKFNAGSTKDWRFNLDKGKNDLNIKGDGTIEFIFRKEVL